MPMSASVFFRHCSLHIFIFVQMEICGDICTCFSAFARRVTRYLTFYRKRQKDRTQRCGLDFFRIYAVNGKTRKTIRFERYGVLRLFGVSFQKCLAVCRENRVFDFFSCVRVYRMNNVSEISVGSFS